MPRLAFLPLLLLLTFPTTTNAMFAEDAGVLDVLVATAGHGAPRFAHGVAGQSVLTTDATGILGSASSSCLLASRNLETGQVNWRRRICSSEDGGKSHAIAAFGKQAVTLDHTGQVRAWDGVTGDLQWEVSLWQSPAQALVDPGRTRVTLEQSSQDDHEKLWVRVSGLSIMNEEYNDDSIYIQAHTGQMEQLTDAQVQTLQTVSFKTTSSSDEEDTTTVVACPALLHSDEARLVLSAKAQTLYQLASTFAGSRLDAAPTPVAMLDGNKDGTLPREHGAWERLHLVECSNDSMTVLATTSRSVSLLLTITEIAQQESEAKEEASSSSATLQAEIVWIAQEGLSRVSGAVLLDDSHHYLQAADASSSSGSADSVAKSVQDVLSFSSRLQSHWQALQDVLSSVMSLMDASYAHSNSANNGNGGVMSSFFGFPKIAVLVSNQSHRLYGMPTAGPNRGQVAYTVDLPLKADWHRLVHGAPNADKAVRGVHGHVSHRDVLVVSASPTEAAWTCVDGATGRRVVVSQTKDKDNKDDNDDKDNTHVGVALSAPVAQIVPVPSTGACRQAALLLLEDRNVVVALAPNSQLLPTLASNNKGLFAHRLIHHGGGGGRSDDKNNNKEDASGMETLHLSVDAKDGTAQVDQRIGQAQFPGERIVAAAYPGRDEVIQSPCHVLGDQSLLLKYLNPHLAVIMTTTAAETSVPEKDEDSDRGGAIPKEKDPFAQAFDSVQENKGTVAAVKPQQRKPMGAGNAAATLSAPEGQTASLDDDPNLFINVVDTVSGRVLYRAAHSNVILTPSPSLVVSENWIFYSFMNQRTHRAEIGVLSLYEGMVDSKGLTAFTTPDQQTSFSSLDARETQPVVLAKTFSVARPVTAMGVTHTRGGISGKKLIVATMDGSVYSLDRKMLEPRRPMGQVKESEKQEGLRQYSELIPLISYLSLSYTQTVEGVTHIASAPTELESQTVVLCYGGPDLFVARTSPSRGFDLLPDSFSRVMLSIVVVALIGIYMVLQRIVFTKTVRKGWV